jgi:hypothetical protein
VRGLLEKSCVVTASSHKQPHMSTAVSFFVPSTGEGLAHPAMVPQTRRVPSPMTLSPEVIIILQ